MLTLRLKFALTAAIAFAAGLWLRGTLTGNRDEGPRKSARSAGAASFLQQHAEQELSGPEANNSPEKLTPTDIKGHLLSAVRQRDYFRRKHDLYELALQLDSAGLRQAMEAAQDFAEYDRNWLGPTLIARWLEVDPDAALSWTRALPQGGQRDLLLREYFQSFGLKDPTRGLDYLKTWLASPNRGRENLAYMFFEGWSAHDPSGAARAAAEFPDKDARRSGMTISISRWAQRDPIGALAWLDICGVENARRDLADNVYKAWAAHDSQSAVNYVGALPEGRERNMAYLGILSGVATRDRAEALHLLDSLPVDGLQRNNMISSLVSSLSYSDPKTAAELILRLPAAQQANSVFQVAQYLVKDDIPAALDWASKLSSDEARRRSMGQIVRAMSDADPKGALDLVLAQNLKLQPYEWTNAVSELTRRSPDEAITWARQLSDAKMRTEALNSSLATIASKDPQRAITLCAQLLTPQERDVALGRIAASWAGSDPAASAQWAAQLPEGDGRQNAFSNIASRWANESPTAVAAWLEKIPAGSARDGAVGGFSSAIQRTDPPAAADWAATISDESKRSYSLNSILYEWHRIDRAAAESWLRQSSALSEQMRKNMLQSWSREN